jgi:poly-gamma-glutamate synthesis protein (capsule biosynthesis protein)
VSAAGDVTLGGDTRGRTHAAFAAAWKKNGADYFFQNVREIFEGDDLSIVNLEGPLTRATRHREKEFAFKGDPAYAQILVSGSVEAANLANNHAKDYYDKGLNDTADALKKAGVTPFGWGNSQVLEIKGVKVGLAGFGVWYISASQLKKQVAALKAQCDLVIVSIHGGEEGEGRATKAQKSYARAAVNGGALLVLGHHPHVVGGIEVYKGAVIAYSLGNFCFGGNLNPSDKDTFILRQTFTVGAEGIVPAETLVIPCAISGSKKKNDYQPAPLAGDDAERVLGRVEKLSRGFDAPVDLTASRARLAG